jgi:DMSO/TMAO reductase YedYZ molybdopterin-dependent catalytic subunit
VDHHTSRRFRWASAAVLAVIATAASGFALVEGQQDAQQVEIRDYQGERLGSVSDFRENSIHGVQVIDPDSYTLTIDGLVATPTAYSYQDLEAMPHSLKVVTIHCVEGWSVKALWEGIPLADLFTNVTALPEANTVIFYAADGYTTSLPLDVVVGRNLIIADRINGIVLPAQNGFPFQLVAEDKWGYKWIRWITRVELSSDASYKGYWERLGYSNSGELTQSMFEL